jgi:cell wall-associated NlpC family hydrolase
LEGYVSSELLATGKKAKKIAKKVAYHYAAVIAEKLNVRETADAEGEVFTSLNEGAEVEIVEDNGDWLKVCLDADTYGYINSSYAVKKTDYPTGQTMAQMEEERARAEAQAQAESERQAQAEAQAQAETEVQENSPEPMEMELEPVLAYAKEEAYTEPQSETQEEYQAENQTEYQRDYQAEDPAEVQEQSETQVEYQEELEPETQAEYSEESQPETQAEYSEESQPETQEEYQEEFQPETQEEYQEESQLETQTESQTESQPETSAPEILTDEYMAEAADHAEADAAAAAEETAASELPAEEAEKQTVPESSAGQAAADYACQFVGNPYVWGGTSLTEGADCSGFTLAVYAKYGVTLPHYAASQASCGTQISLSQLAPGDLVFFSSDGSEIDHVAIYIGNNSIVHAANTQSGIIISSLEWQNPVSAARVV